MIRKLIIKQTISPILLKKRTLVWKQDHNKEISTVINRLKRKEIILSIIVFFFIHRRIISHQMSI
jgi:hypothetical protein